MNQRKNLLNLNEKTSQGMKSLQFNHFKNNQIGSVYDSGNLIIWDLNQQKPNLFLKEAHNAPSTMIKYSKDNSSLFSVKKTKNQF